MKLELSSFKKAIESLERAIIRAEKDRTDEEIRDAVIQRFEYTYELSWKMLKRQLEIDSANFQFIDFNDLIREGTKKGIIKTAQAWFDYRYQGLLV